MKQPQQEPGNGCSRGSAYPILSAEKNHKVPEQPRRLLVNQGLVLRAPHGLVLGKVDHVHFVGVVSGGRERAAPVGPRSSRRYPLPGQGPQATRSPVTGPSQGGWEQLLDSHWGPHAQNPGPCCSQHSRLVWAAASCRLWPNSTFSPHWPHPAAGKPGTSWPLLYSTTRTALWKSGL